jgi:adenylate cyclase
MQETLKRYFGETLSEKILDNKGVLKGDNIWVSISFTDIASYSTIIEHMSPETAVKFLNEYFTSMHDVIEKFNGQIINYIGDCVMVVFGAPKKLEDHEILSVRCAIEMREKLNELNKFWDNSEFSRYWKNHGINKISARTGIHTGSVTAGNIGSNRMLQYSTIGDTVNVASRLEQNNKDFSTDILFSHEIYSSLTKDLYDQAKYQGEINLKGRNTKTKTYSI